MSLSIVHTRAALGVNAPPITVEVHISKGLPGLTMVGLPETTVKEARDRVRSAIINSGYEYPAKKITINLAPADLPKEGGRYDLPIAIALLAASEQLTANKLDEYELVGELALTGALRGVPGAISSATEAIKSGRKIIVAKDNEDEVGLINGEGCLIADHLQAVARFWKVSTLSNTRNQLMQYPGRYNMISVMLSVRSKESEDWKLPPLAGTTFY
ncbi:Mg chelatase-like protein [Escherichia coli cloneA_i1]|nr:Mg chelatase-like protein [Escherichia coli cloneA_i1]